MFCFETVNFMLKIIYPAGENHGFFLTVFTVGSGTVSLYKFQGFQGLVKYLKAWGVFLKRHLTHRRRLLLHAFMSAYVLIANNMYPDQTAPI